MLIRDVIIAQIRDGLMFNQAVILDARKIMIPSQVLGKLSWLLIDYHHKQISFELESTNLHHHRKPTAWFYVVCHLALRNNKKQGNLSVDIRSCEIHARCYIDAYNYIVDTHAS